VTVLPDTFAESIATDHYDIVALAHEPDMVLPVGNFQRWRSDFRRVIPFMIVLHSDLGPFTGVCQIGRLRRPICQIERRQPGQLHGIICLLAVRAADEARPHTAVGILKIVRSFPAIHQQRPHDSLA